MDPVTTHFEQVALHFQASSLPQVSTTFSRTLNPFVVLFTLDNSSGNLVPLGYTEVVKENVNPTWSSSFVVDYNFQCVQEFVMRIYHHSGSHDVKDLARHELIGGANFKLSQLMRAPEQKVTLLFNGAPGALVQIRGETLASTRDNFLVTFSAHKLSNKEGFFSTSDPFLEISRLNEDGAWTVVWKNKHINSTLNPSWGEEKIPMALLCNGDIDRPLKIKLYDHERSGKHVFMGQIETSVRHMLQQAGRSMDVIEPEKKAKKKSYVNSGTLNAGKPSIEQNPTFGDFIVGGLEVSLIVAIDFTSSNGDPTLPTSLHFLGGGENAYQYAIRSICSILEPYDADQMYPVYGFGAKLRLPDQSLSPAQHCFPIYPNAAEVRGVEGVLKAYGEGLGGVMLSGPTLFAPLIQNAAQIVAQANCSQTHPKYFILLVLTDGVVNDLELTKQAIIRASLLPLSIIIIGVGSADFADMHALDSDDQLLSCEGQQAARDIVQFVALRDYAGKGREALAQQVLAEVPDQVLLYMRQHSILPNTAKFNPLLVSATAK